MERLISKKILTNRLVRNMIIKTIKVSEKGQIALPVDIREQANIHKGDSLIVIEDNGKILLEKTNEKIKDSFKDLLKLSERSLKNVWNNKSDNIWGSYLKK